MCQGTKWNREACPRLLSVTAGEIGVEVTWASTFRQQLQLEGLRAVGSKQCATVRLPAP